MSDILKDTLENVEGVFDSEDNPDNFESRVRYKVLVEMRDKINAELEELAVQEDARRQQVLDDVSKLSFADINNMSHHPEKVKSGDIISSEERPKKTRWDYSDDSAPFKPSRTSNDFGNPIKGV